MRRWSILLLISLIAAATYACRGASSTDTCPLLDAGPPPVCPDGCYWAADSKECRKSSGIILEQSRPDSGTAR